MSRLDNAGQPITFANKLVSAGVAGSAGLPVTGAIADRNPANKDWLIIGAGGQSNTVQDHAKVKLAYDFSPTLRASYTLGWWGNDTVREAESYLRDAAGAPVYRGDANNFINIGGRRYELRASDFAPSIGALEHLMQGVSLKRHARAEWDWEIAASKYDYREDLVRTPTVLVPDARTSGQGTLTDLAGSGWNTLALKGIWRPQSGARGRHGPAIGQRAAAHQGVGQRRLDRRGAGCRHLHVQRQHAAAKPVRAGHLALRAAVEGDAGRARGALACVRRRAVECREHASLVRRAHARPASRRKRRWPGRPRTTGR